MQLHPLPVEVGEVVGTNCGMSLNLFELESGEKVPTEALVGSRSVQRRTWQEQCLAYDAAASIANGGR